MVFRSIFLSLTGLLLFQPLSLAAQQRPAVTPQSGGGAPRSSESGSSIGGLSDGPIGPGEVVHINVTDIMTSYADPGKASQILNWRAQIKMQDVVKLMLEDELNSLEL